MAFKGHLSIMFESTTNFRESNFKNRAAPRFLKGKHPLETADLEKLWSVFISETRKMS